MSLPDIWERFMFYMLANESYCPIPSKSIVIQNEAIHLPPVPEAIIDLANVSTLLNMNTYVKRVGGYTEVTMFDQESVIINKHILHTNTLRYRHSQSLTSNCSQLLVSSSCKGNINFDWCRGGGRRFVIDPNVQESKTIDEPNNTLRLS